MIWHYISHPFFQDDCIPSRLCLCSIRGGGKNNKQKKIKQAIYCLGYVSQAFSYPPACQGYSVYTTVEGQPALLHKTFQMFYPQSILCKSGHKHILRQLLKGSPDKQHSVAYETQYQNKDII